MRDKHTESCANLGTLRLPLTEAQGARERKLLAPRSCQWSNGTMSPMKYK